MKTNIHSILIIYLLFIAINPSKAVADVRTLGKVAKEIGRYSDEKPDEKVKYSINPIQIKAPLPIKPNLRLSPDPIRFSIQCDKDSITKGELFTITLTAELLPITSSMLFFFEEQKGFSLNLLLPKGFVQTGGDYFPYISDKLSPDSKKSISYTVKGYLDDVSQSATFTLLRGPKDATSNSLFERKGAVTLWQKYTSINSGKPASRQALVCTVKDQIDGLLFGKNQQGLFVIKVLTKSSASGIVYSLDNANFQTSNILTTSAIAGKVYFRYAADTACKSSLNFNLVPFISSNNSSTINKTAGTCGVEGFSVSPYPICKLNNNEFTISSVLNNWSGCSELSVQQIQNGVLSIIKTLTAGDLINNQGFIQLSFQGTVPETIIFRCDCSGNYQGWFVDLGNLSVTTPNDQVVTLSDGLPASRSGCQSVTFNVSGCANNSVYLLRKPNNTYTEINSTGVFTIAPGATGSFPYSIECLDACGQFTSNPLNVTANITHLNSPTIASSSSNTLSIGSTLSLTATGSCSNGTITWYRGNSLSIATGPVLSYTGIQTTTFFARCIQNQCSSPNSNSITITVLPFSVSPSSLNICPGSLFTLTSSGCGVGITWYNVTDDVVYTNTTSSLSTSLTITSLIKATCGSGQNAPNAFIQVTMSSPNIAFTSTTACTGSPAGQISVGISNPSNDFIDYRYRLESLDGQTVFTNWGINPNAFTYTFSNLVNGSYRIKVVKGSPTDCAASAIVTINCECGITVNGLPASNTVLIGNLLSLTAVRPQGMGSSTPLIWSGPTGSNFFVQSPTNTTVTSYSILGDIAYIAPNAIGTFKLRISNQAVPSCYNDYSLTVLPFACGCTDCDLPALVNTDNLSVFHAASTNQNFVVETVYLNTAGSHFNQTVSYFDGLGRPTQQVQIASGGSAYTQSGPGQDIVTIQEYDTVGRQVRKYLPITQSSNSGAFRTTIQASTINSYYNNTLERPGNAFTSINYEASPLNRVLSQTAPGSTTVVTMTQRTNSTADAVKLLTYVFSTSTVNVSSYSANALIVTEITNENNQKTTEYKDKQGRVICRDIAGLKTYYCYDDIGQLRCVIPPKAIGLLNNTSITPFDGANDLLFAYYYDNRGRLTRKKVPGSGITTLAYDNQDRLINTTDAKNISIITTYDVLDRVVSTSIAGGEMLTQNYYDNYSYAGSKAFDLSHAYSQPALATAQGLLTGSKVWGLGSANNQSWISTTHYDLLGRVIQTSADNHLGGVDKVSSKLDFVGRVLETKLSTLNNLTIETRNSYDRASRLKAVCQRVTDNLSAATNTVGQYWEPISRHSYNDLGELTRKTLGCNLQNIDYTYHMRGWLTSLNKPTNLEQGNDKDLFGMSLAYDGIGNISSWNYRSGQKQGLYAGSTALSQNPLMGYSFGYDTQNRLKAATLTQNASTTVFAMGGNDAGKIGYDDNGNILSLSRTLNGTPVDNLSYIYGPNSNTLSSVSDVASNTSIPGFFGANASYSYDANGNLITDSGKGIVNVNYNHLNLPQRVTNPVAAQNISYTYTAIGQKLRADMGGGKLYDYVAGMVYEGGKLEFVPNAEGRILPPGRAINPASGTSVVANRYYRYEYQLKDHLGNLRVACRCPEISTAVAGSQLPGPGDTYPIMTVQEEQYDPWGLSLSGLNSQTMLTANRFKFSGKEEQQGSGWIDLIARQYDPQTGRFIAVDPLTDEQEAWAPYHYTYNNPVNYVDLFGLSPTSSNAIAECPTCPKDKKYDEYRDSKALYTYDKATGIVLNGDGKGATVYGQRTSYDYNDYSGFSIGAGRYANFLGDNNVSTRAKFTGATPGTSIASQYFRQKLGHKTTPEWMFKMLPKRARIGRFSMPLRSNNYGAVAGRSVPILGRGLIVTGVGWSVYNVSTAENKAEALSVEAGGWAGAWAAGTAAGATLTATGIDLGGPWGWLAHGVITVGAGVGGFWGGSQAGQAIYDKTKE